MNVNTAHAVATIVGVVIVLWFVVMGLWIVALRHAGR